MSPPVRLESAMLFLPFLLLLVMIAPGCGGSTTPTPLQGQSLAEALPQVMEEVARVRGLEFQGQVQWRLVSPAEMSEVLTTLLEEEQENFDNLEQLYRVLGLLEPGVRLFPLLMELLQEQVVGLYDPQSDKLYVLQGGMGSLEELTMAHELTHALQQQHFDIHGLQQGLEGNLDGELALSALIEGDAVLTEKLYQKSRSLSDPQLPDTPLIDSAPRVVREWLIFPYVEGVSWAEDIQPKGGSWQSINEAYRALPSSTEQVVHPNKYLAQEVPVEVNLPDLLPALGPDWKQTFSSVAGEFLVRTYLGQGLPGSQAEEAAAGWGGDRFALFRDGQGQDVLAWAILWDDQEEARQFYQASQHVVASQDQWERSFQGTAEAWWGREGRWVRLEWEGDRVVLVVAPEEDATQEIALLLKGS